MLEGMSTGEVLAIAIPSALSVAAIVFAFVVARPGNAYAKKSYISDLEQRLDDCETKHDKATIEMSEMRVAATRDREDCAKRIAMLEGEVRALRSMIDLYKAQQ